MTNPNTAAPSAPSDTFEEVRWELRRAQEKFAPFNSAHEGYAVILEELDELWQEVQRKDRSPYDMRAEAIQVAAMALRFVEDLCPTDDRAPDAPQPEQKFPIAQACPECGKAIEIQRHDGIVYVQARVPVATSSATMSFGTKDMPVKTVHESSPGAEKTFLDILAEGNVAGGMSRNEFALRCIAAGHCDGPTATAAWDAAASRLDASVDDKTSGAYSNCDARVGNGFCNMTRGHEGPHQILPPRKSLVDDASDDARSRHTKGVWFTNSPPTELCEGNPCDRCMWCDECHRLVGKHPHEQNCACDPKHEPRLCRRCSGLADSATDDGSAPRTDALYYHLRHAHGQILAQPEWAHQQFHEAKEWDHTHD